MSIVGASTAVGQFVVERAREDARGRGLADAADAGEHVGVRDAAALERIAQIVRTIASWPIRSAKVDGRYLRASTR